MSEPRNLIVVGAGGFGVEVVWAAEAMNDASPDGPVWNILGYADDDPEQTGATYLGHKVLGCPDDLAGELEGEIWFHTAIGNNGARKRVCERMLRHGWKPATLVDPRVVCGGEVTIGDGVFVGPLSILAPCCTLGDFVLINTHAGIGHHAVLADYSQVCPGGRVNGFCELGTGAFVGSNAVLQPGVKVGDEATVASCAQVIRNVKPNTTVLGSPARVFGRGR
jgi:sugar O-acyltransferase (sialic acid O-acetyltransferase NeuD family)